MADRNKIAQELTVEELDAFIAQLSALPGKERTLASIKARAAGLGIEISIESARTFRNTTFARHLQRLSKAQELATQVAAMQESGAGNTLADASAAMLSQQIFEMLNVSEELELADAGKLAFIISKLRQGDVAVRNLELKLRDAERREREQEEKKAAAVKELQKLRDPQEKLNDNERAAIVAKVDEILGIKS